MLHFKKKLVIELVLSLFLVLITNSLRSQTKLNYTEDSGKVKSISFTFLQKNKSLIIIESSQTLTFESSVENITSPEKRDNNRYFLEVNSGPQVITISRKNENINIPFGQIDNGNYAALKPGEIRYFKIGEQKTLKYSNITDPEKAKGSVPVGIGMDPSDAQIILKFSPSNLDVKIEDPKKVISKISPQPNGDQILFIKMNDISSDLKKDIVLNLNDKEYGITEMKIFDLSKKEQRFYNVEKFVNKENTSSEVEKLALELKTAELKIAEENRKAQEALLATTQKKEHLAQIQKEKENANQREREEKAQKKAEEKERNKLGPFSSIGLQSGEIAKYGLLYEYGGSKIVGFHLSGRTSFTPEEDILNGSGIENKTEIELGPNFRLSNRLYFNVGVGYGYYDKVVNNDYAGTLALEKTGYLVTSSGLMVRISRVVNINGGVTFMDIYNAFHKPEITFGVSFNLKK